MVERKKQEAMWKKLMRKLNKRSGFSLTELLAAVLILGMVSSVVAGGIPVAKDAYEKVTLSANAQVMLSTAISALRNELCIASKVKTDASGNKLTFFSGNIQNDCTIEYDATANSIMMTPYNKASAKRDLVSDATGDYQLKVICSNGGMSYDKSKGIVTITGLRVVDNDNPNKVYAYMDGDESSKLQIRVIIDQ